MTWQRFSLAVDDQKARKHVLETLELGALEHTLSKKLLLRFREANGPMLLIADETVDLDADCLYKHATYKGGQFEIPGLQAGSWMDSSIQGLILFVGNHLQESKDAIVLCENPFARSNDVANDHKESRLLFYEDEVYHILTKADAANDDSIECALRESRHHWSVAVCSFSERMPEADALSEDFIDVVVTNAVHIVVVAIDGEGYLVWSPGASRRGECF